MEITRFTPGEFNLDDMVFDSIEITLIKVTPEDFTRAADAMSNLTGKQVVARAPRPTEAFAGTSEKSPQTKPKNESVDADDVISKLTDMGTASAAQISIAIHRAGHNAKRKAEISNILDDLKENGTIEQDLSKPGPRRFKIAGD